ncbi:MAG TPA: NfeD family protein [Longimicrobium sp.]|nr:NfeD family protein [Longimicrobium sp.]
MAQHIVAPAPLRRALGLAAAALALLPAMAAAQERTVYRVPIHGEIVPGLVPYVERSLKEAAEAKAAAVLLDIDTPGGLIDTAEQISDAVRDADVPVYAFVNRRALSAGAMIALSTRGVYMLPGSALGAATPVDGAGTKASEKYVSAMRSEFRALAEARGLDPRIAEAMVDEDVAVPGVDEKGKLLTLSTREAVRVGYAFEVASWEGALAAVGAPRAAVTTPASNWAERVVRFLSNPLVAPFLLTFGFLGLIIELKTPTFGLAGLAGLGSLTLFFGSHYILGLAGWESVALIAAGIVLVLVEIFVIPGFGVAGVLGIAAVAGSILLALVGAHPTAADLSTAALVLTSSLIMVAFSLWALLRHLPHDRRARNLILQGGLASSAGYRAAAARADLHGAEGVTVTDLRPAGTAEFAGERLDVVSEGDFVPAGTAVRVVRSEGYRHVVEPLARE